MSCTVLNISEVISRVVFYACFMMDLEDATVHVNLYIISKVTNEFVYKVCATLLSFA